jgi:hypothetical protein
MRTYLLGTKKDIFFFRAHLTDQVGFHDVEIPDWNATNVNPTSLDMIISGIEGHSVIPIVGLCGFDYLLRVSIFSRLLLKRVFLLSYIFPGYEYLRPDDVGRGAIVLGGSCINPGVKIGIGSVIGECCYVGSGVNIGSSTVIGSFSRIGSLAKIGNETFLAKDTSISDETLIGNNCHIDQSSTVKIDMDSGSIVIERMSVTASVKVVNYV